MTSATDDLRLAADFAPATYDDWRKLVDGVLKGAPFEKLVGKTYDGLRIEPIYPRAQGAAPIAGRAAAAPWQIMQRIDHPDAAQANAQALHDLENGATGLTLVFAGANGAHGFGLEPIRRSAGEGPRRRLSRCRHRHRASDRSAVADGRDPPRRIHQAQRHRSRRLAISASVSIRSAPARCGDRSPYTWAEIVPAVTGADQGPRRAWASRDRSRSPMAG